MTYLLDTHVFLWAAINPEQLSVTAKRLLETQKENVSVSSVSFWEISLKYALNKLELTGIEPDELPSVAQKMSLTIVPLAADDAASFFRLPKEAHADPFDRMLVWQCLRNGLTLVSADRDLRSYRNTGLRLVW